MKVNSQIVLRMWESRLQEVVNLAQITKLMTITYDMKLISRRQDREFIDKDILTEAIVGRSQG